MAAASLSSLATPGWHAFDSDAQGWLELVDGEQAAADGPPVPDILRLVTFNIWFEPLEAELRMAGLIDAMLGEAPDGCEPAPPHFVALQEATPRLMALILADDRVRARYAVCGLDARPYGVVMLGDRRLAPRVPEVRRVVLPTTMDGRTLLMAVGPRLVIGGVHLDSKPHNEAVRGEQVEVVKAALEGARGAAGAMAVMGDFNYHVSGESGKEVDDAMVSGELVDAWRECKVDAAGLTFDCEVNAMLAADKAPKKVQVRFDRVYAAGAEPVAAAVIGQRAIDGCEVVWPSDHFGLVAWLQL